MYANMTVLFYSSEIRKVLNSLFDSKYVPFIENSEIIVISNQDYRCHILDGYTVINVEDLILPKDKPVYVVLNAASGEVLIPLIEKLTLSPLEFHCKKIELKTTS